MAAIKNATLQKSTGVTLSTITAVTARQLVHNGSATVVTKGASGFDVIKLKTPTLDTTHTAATANAPISHGIDDVLFKPVTFPEPTKF